MIFRAKIAPIDLETRPQQGVTDAA